MTHLVYIYFLCHQFLSVFGGLVQVSSNGSVSCPNEPAVFICSGNFANWEIRPGIGFTPYVNSYSIHSEVNEQIDVIKSVEVVFQIIYKNESFVAVQLTIPTPIPLIGSNISCSEESIQLIMTHPQPILQLSLNGLVQIYSPCKNITYHLEVKTTNFTLQMTFYGNISTHLNWSSLIDFSDYVMHISYQIENDSVYHSLSNITLAPCIMSDNVTTRRLYRFDNGIWTIYNYCEDINVLPVQVICTYGSWNATVNCSNEGNVSVVNSTSQQFDNKFGDTTYTTTNYIKTLKEIIIESSDPLIYITVSSVVFFFGILIAVIALITALIIWKCSSINKKMQREKEKAEKKNEDFYEELSHNHTTVTVASPNNRDEKSLNCGTQYSSLRRPTKKQLYISKEYAQIASLKKEQQPTSLQTAPAQYSTINEVDLTEKCLVAPTLKNLINPSNNDDTSSDIEAPPLPPYTKEREFLTTPCQPLCDDSRCDIKLPEICDSKDRKTLHMETNSTRNTGQSIGNTSLSLLYL